MNSWSDWREKPSSSAARLMFQFVAGEGLLMSFFSTLVRKALKACAHAQPLKKPWGSPELPRRGPHPVGKLDTWPSGTSSCTRDP